MLVCHVILQDHIKKRFIIQWSGNHRVKISGDRQSGCRNIMLLLCHGILSYHRISYHLSRFVAIHNLVVEI